jgi:NAD(P)H-hydrate epimerase
MQENQQYTGQLHILNIGLHEDFLKSAASNFILVDGSLAHDLLRPRKKFSHKGDYGHGALITGSLGINGELQHCAPKHLCAVARESLPVTFLLQEI